MRKNVLCAACMFLLLVTGTLQAMAYSKIGLSFVRTGTDAAGVSVRVVDENGRAIEGVSATLVSSHAFKATGNDVTSGILCPDVNANTSPVIELTVSVSGLPSTMEFREAGLKIHALNSAGSYQQNNDNKVRQYNVELLQGETAASLTSFAALQDIDVAAGVGTSGNVCKVWSMSASGAAATVGSTLVLKLRVTKGSENGGCFFGLSHITLGGTEAIEPSETPEPVPGLSGIYNIVWKSNTNSFMSEEADGSVVVAGYDVSRRCFWELVPTDKDNCYYIRNTATGRYIGSCNMTPASASKVKTSASPVEYYIGQTAATAAEIAGCYWLSSTDCAAYAEEAESPRALNKDGASDNVIVWQAGPNNGNYRVGSYWRLVKTENLYEVRPFLSSDEVGKPRYRYAVSSPEGTVLEMAADGTLSWQAPNETEQQAWYFVGQGNAGGGYSILNVKYGKAVSAGDEETAKWCVFESGELADTYVFRPFETKEDAATNLSVGGVSQLKFRLLRSAFALSAQIYEMPCGTLAGQYVTKASVSGEGALVPMAYPLPVISGNEVLASSASRPNSWYTLYTQDKATVAAGKDFRLRIELNAAPASGQTAYVYFDWNRDGVFETAHPLTVGQNMSAVIDVPENAGLGRSRMRFRLTDNGQDGPEDDVTGQIIDFILDVTDDVSEEYPVKVSSNDETRGSALLQDGETASSATAVAVPKGNASFVCWREGKKIVSVDATYTFARDHVIDLVAFFSPNTELTPVGVEAAPSTERNVLIEVSAESREIKVKTSAGLKKIQLFSPDGALVADSKSDVLSTKHLHKGIYIVKVVTDVEDAAAKVIVK